MKSFKMKALALATLGLAGFAFAGGAMAATCTNSTPFAAWSAQAALSGGTLAGVDAFDPSGGSCAMSASLGSSSVSEAAVLDSSPQNEPRYRFQFLIDNGTLTNLSAQDSVGIFTATNQTAAHGKKTVIQVFLVPTGTAGINKISFTYSCNNGTTFRCIHSSTANLVAGSNRIEFDVQMATPGNSDGVIRYWINAPTGNQDASPTESVTGVNNSDWVGVKLATLGLISPAPAFSTAHAGQTVLFDSFDSRRQTYIGN